MSGCKKSWCIEVENIPKSEYNELVIAMKTNGVNIGEDIRTRDAPECWNYYGVCDTGWGWLCDQISSYDDDVQCVTVFDTLDEVYAHLSDTPITTDIVHKQLTPFITKELLLSLISSGVSGEVLSNIIDVYTEGVKFNHKYVIDFDSMLEPVNINIDPDSKIPEQAIKDMYQGDEV